MLTISNTNTMNWSNAIRGARNPMNSWDKMDSRYDEDNNFLMGPNDWSLAARLCAAGSDHRKFIRQIFVCMDVNAPLYWWKEYDTYKISTVANSCSTMHKLTAKPFALDDFSTDHMTSKSLIRFVDYVDYLESLRQRYIETHEITDWYDLIQLLPSSYNQLRTVTLNYENLRNIYQARRYHKLAEWHTFCDWIETLPYANILILPHQNEAQEV